MKTIFNYQQIDNFKQHLVSRLDKLHMEKDPEEACNHIIKAYTDGISKFSRTTTFSRKTDFLKPWMTSAILCSINHKNILFMEKLRKPSASNVNKYNTFRNCLNKTILNAKKRYYNDQFAKNEHNPKKTWETLNKLLRHKSKVHDMPSKFVNDADEELNGSDTISEGFNKFFTEVGEKLKQRIHKNDTDPLKFVQNTEINMTLAQVNDNDVEQIILQLKDVGAGFDGINSKIFKRSYKPILSKLTYFFNLCLTTCIFPKPLKIAVIKPIFKSGDKCSFHNYRPISILPFISKILEKIIYYQLFTFISQNNILTDSQFGFRNNHSTYMPIMLIQNLISEALENNECVVGIYLDLCKAFDTVDQYLLIKKLNKYGIQGNALQIITSYLSERMQTVSIDNYKGRLRNIGIGVPQGSILGPLLFIIYINDIINIDMGGQFFIYADDTAIFFKHSNTVALQNMVCNALPKISDWLEANYLTLNTSKTFTQIYTKRRAEIAIHVQINGVEIKEMEKIKYLGVLIDSDMKFTSHINSITNIVSRNIGMIARTKQFLSKKQLLQLYNSLIFPYINYCCFIWGSNYESQIKKLIILQKRYMRITEGIFPPQSATPIFKKHNILKVKEIAHLQMLLIMHKYLFDELPPAIRRLLQLSPEPSHPTRQVNHFLNKFSTKNYRLFTFAYLGPKLWNNMIPKNFFLNDIPCSKLAFKKYLKSIFVDSY